MSQWGGEASYNKLVQILAQLTAVKGQMQILDSAGTSVLLIDSSGKIGISSLPNVTINDLLRGLTDPASTKKVNEIDFTWNSDGTPATAVYKDSAGATLFTLTFNYVGGNLSSIVRS